MGAFARCQSLAIALLLGTVSISRPASAEPPSFGEPLAMNSQQRDRAAITEIVENIARGADLHQWNVVRASFAREVLLDYGTPETVTPSAVIGRWQPLLEAFDATQHQLSAIAVSVEGDRARASASFQATHWLYGAPGGDVWTLSGHYEYDLVRLADGWRVTRMRMQPRSNTGNEALLDLARQKAGAATADGLQVVERFFEKLESFDIEGFAENFAENGRQVMPFSPAGFPDSLEGRSAIYNQYKGMPQNFKSMKFVDRAIRETSEPGEFVATWRGEIELASGGRYDNTYIGLFQVRDGKLVQFTEYFDPIVLQDSFGHTLRSNFNVD